MGYGKKASVGKGRFEFDKDEIEEIQNTIIALKVFIDT